MTETTHPTEPRRMRVNTIVWAIMVLVFAGLALAYFTTDPVDVTPNLVLGIAVAVGAALVGVGILGAVVRTVLQRHDGP